MPRPCPQFDLRFELTDTAWATHRESCASCRGQWAAELGLRQVFAAPAPVLSGGFEQALHRRLEAEMPARAASPRGLGRFLMPAYWLGAAVASLLLLGEIEWPQGAGLPWLTLLASALSLGVPVLILSRQFGVSFYELVFISAARRPADQILPPLGHGPLASRGG
jgi:hypothetical protein